MASKKKFDLNQFKKRMDSALQEWEASTDELIEAYKQGMRDFSYVYVNTGDLSRTNFDGANFTGGQFFNVSFNYGVFINTVFYEASFTKCTLDSTNFYKADFTDAQLDNCSMTYTDFREANCSYLDIDSSNMRKADLSKANFSSAELDHVDLSESDCQATDFSNATFSIVSLEEAILNQTNFEDSDISSVSFFQAVENHTRYLGATGLYRIAAPNLSSRRDQLVGGIMKQDGKLKLFVCAGCAGPSSAKEMLIVVEDAHGNNVHAKNYIAAIKAMKKMFDADMEEGVWDYLLETEEITK